MNEVAFESHPRLRAVIDAVLEGRCGRVIREGGAALLDFGCYRIPGGDARCEGARALLTGLRGPCEIVVPDDDAWRALIGNCFGARIADRSMQSFLPGRKLTERTHALAADLPEAYDLRRIDAAIAARVGVEVAPHGIDVLGGPEAFVERGLGRALLALDGRPACVASSYAVSSRYVEVAIATHPAHRRRGLAACAAAAMIGDCLERGLEPHWNAFNPVSQRLARRLGFVEVGVCEILALDFGRG